MPDEQVAADFAATGLFLAALSVERRAALLHHGAAEGIEAAQAAQLLASEPEVMLGTLAAVRRAYGSAEAFLMADGVSAREIEALRRQLRERPTDADDPTGNPTEGTTRP